ncbi:hypothetical protein LOK49_Contig14G00024 [Camellia lanceoleosa]|nr:hypothetical protein LOK49_Contig14G00024 [Camellia lanceoleosa]
MLCRLFWSLGVMLSFGSFDAVSFAIIPMVFAGMSVLHQVLPKLWMRSIQRLLICILLMFLVALLLIFLGGYDRALYVEKWAPFVKILLNEVVPRPHNSGHHTIESCFTSQFEQHLRAVVGLPLGDPSMKTPTAIMYNILGEDEVEQGFLLAHQLIGRALGISGASVHWYDKPA